MKTLSTNPRVLLCTRHTRFRGDYGNIIEGTIRGLFTVVLPITKSLSLRFIKQNVPQVEILEYPSWHEYVEKLKEGWDVVGFSFYHIEIAEIKEMIEEARRQGVHEIWAGNYGALDDSVASMVDRVFIGPAEDQIAQVFGYRVSDDEIEHPVMITPVKLKPGNIALLRTGILYTQRGCLFKCKFCQAPLFENRRLTINIESIERVLRYYRKLGISYVLSVDDLFGGYPKFTERLTELLARYKFCWWAESRAAIFLRNLDQWYEQGLRFPSIGVECMDQSSLDAVNKRQTVEEVLEFARRTSEKPGMYRIVFYIIGFENMTADDIIEDAMRVKRAGFDFHGVNIITPYPKTPLWYELDSKYGIFDHTYRHYDTKHLVWSHPYITPAQMKQIREEVAALLNDPFSVCREAFSRVFSRGSAEGSLGFVWRNLVKGRFLSMFISDRKQVFFPRLGVGRDK